MGRPSKIQPVIITVLSQSETPLRFSEIKEKVMLELKREKLDDKQLDYNLKKLLDEGEIEKILYDDKPAYVLSTSYYEQSLKSALIKLISNRSLSQLYDRLEGEDQPPYIVFLDPPAFNYQTNSPIETLGYYEKYNLFGGGTMEPGNIRIEPNWINPLGSISSVMLNDFWGLYSIQKQDKIIQLLKWAYWFGCRKYIDDNTYFNLQNAIKENRVHAKEIIEKYSQDQKRIEAEKALLSILDLTEELFEKDNLGLFLSYLFSNKSRYENLLNIIYSSGGSMNAGERIFSNFFKFGSMVIDGLAEAGLLEVDKPLNRLSMKHQYFISSSEVWTNFIEELFLIPNFPLSDSDITDSFNDVKGTQEESIQKVKLYGDIFTDLIELPFKRKMVLVYLWGFPETIHLSNRSVIRTFDDWLSALKKGNLDHRNWLFSEKTLDRLEKAYRCVKRRKEPMDIRIDKEPWTLRDLYLHHPFGKEVDFWDKIIQAI
ncbi:MAG: hypothetical protein ACFFDN_48825, partial [Candidatus Hodarchaeota archaeon]